MQQEENARRLDMKSKFHLADLAATRRAAASNQTQEEGGVASMRKRFFLKSSLSAGLACCLTPLPSVAEGAPVRSLLEMRQDRLVMQSFDLSCGAAALATVLTYQHGDPVSEMEIARALIRRPEYLANPEVVKYRQGFSLLDLKRYVDSRGYEGVGFGNLEMQDLGGLAPILLPIRINGYSHFVVYRGAHGDRVLLGDPAYGNRTLRIDRFENAWIDAPQFGRVGFLVERRDGVAPPNRLAPRPRDFVM